MVIWLTLPPPPTAPHPPAGHTSRFMVIWLTLLPLGLVSSCGMGTIPLAGEWLGV